MANITVTFFTKPVRIAPRTEGPYKDLPRTQREEYTRVFPINLKKVSVRSMLDFYGRQYKVASYSVSCFGRYHTLGIFVTEIQLAQLLADAKQNRNRLKKRVTESIDARRLNARLDREAALR